MPKLLADAETTKMFEHFADPDQNSDEYVRLNAIKGEDIQSKLGFSVPDNFEIRFVMKPGSGIECEIFLLNHETKRVLYFNRVEKTEFILPLSGDKPVSQVMIWREIRGKDRSVASGLVSAIFFELLVKDYNIVVSDSEQTRDGHRMWEGLLSDAMLSDKHIAAAFDVKEDKLRLILNEHQLNEESKWLWGEHEIHRERLGVIAASI